MNKQDNVRSVLTSITFFAHTFSDGEGYKCTRIRGDGRDVRDGVFYRQDICVTGWLEIGLECRCGTEHSVIPGTSR